MALARHKLEKILYNQKTGQAKQYRYMFWLDDVGSDNNSYHATVWEQQ